MPLGRKTTVLLRGVAALLLLGALAAGLALVLARQALDKKFQGYPGSSVVVHIPLGTSVREGLRLLREHGVIGDERLARLYWRFALEDPVLIAGEYRFEGLASTPEVLAKITRGEILTHRVTILEGLTLDEIATHLSAEGFGSYEAFRTEMNSPARVSDIDEEATDLEGYLFPDTYAFARGTPEAQIVNTLVAAFEEHFREAAALAASVQGEGNSTPGGAPGSRELLTTRELVILASIVEKEALLDEERPIIAGVYSNRLGRNMGLYADPTIIYALKRQGTWDGNLRRRDLEMESPYNTYRTAGLPPGPICSPGLASLAAAMAPADVPYLYFVSRNDGTHVFASSLAEHNRNVHQWQKLYWQERWARKAQAAEGEEVH